MNYEAWKANQDRRQEMKSAYQNQRDRADLMLSLIQLGAWITEMSHYIPEATDGGSCAKQAAEFIDNQLVGCGVTIIYDKDSKITYPPDMRD